MAGRHIPIPTHNLSQIHPLNQHQSIQTQGGAEDKTDYLMAAASYAGRVFVFIIVVFKMAYVGVKVYYVFIHIVYVCYI